MWTSSTLEVMHEKHLTLEIDVIDRTDRMFGRDRIVTRVVLPIAQIANDTMQDVWLDCYPFIDVATPVTSVVHAHGTLVSTTTVPTAYATRNDPEPNGIVTLVAKSSIADTASKGTVRTVAIAPCNIANYNTLEPQQAGQQLEQQPEQQQAEADQDIGLDEYERRLCVLNNMVPVKYAAQPCIRLHLMFYKSLDYKVCTLDCTYHTHTHTHTDMGAKAFVCGC
jgi:hypothetical protein